MYEYDSPVGASCARDLANYMYEYDSPVGASCARDLSAKMSEKPKTEWLWIAAKKVVNFSGT